MNRDMGTAYAFCDGKSSLVSGIDENGK